MHTSIKNHETNDPFLWLTRDHQYILSLFEQLKQHTANTTAMRKNIFNEIKSAIDRHEKIEEKIFYPAAKRTEEVRELGFESYEEHFVLNFLLNKLDEMSKGHEEWHPTLIVLFENIARHFEKEEKEIFEKMKNALPKEQLDQIMKEIDELTKE